MSGWFCDYCYMAGDSPFRKEPKWLHHLLGRYSILRPIFNALIKGENE